MSTLRKEIETKHKEETAQMSAMLGKIGSTFADLGMPVKKIQIGDDVVSFDGDEQIDVIKAEPVLRKMYAEPRIGLAFYSRTSGMNVARVDDITMEEFFNWDLINGIVQDPFVVYADGDLHPYEVDYSKMIEFSKRDGEALIKYGRDILSEQVRSGSYGGKTVYIYGDVHHFNKENLELLLDSHKKYEELMGVDSKYSVAVKMKAAMRSLIEASLIGEAFGIVASEKSVVETMEKEKWDELHAALKKQRDSLKRANEKLRQKQWASTIVRFRKGRYGEEKPDNTYVFINYEDDRGSQLTLVK